MPKTGSRALRKPRLKQPYCKPCWELHYCPYGPLVEYFPGAYTDEVPRSQVEETHQRAIESLRSPGESGIDIDQSIEMYLNSFPGDYDWLIQYEASELRCTIFGHVCPVFFSAEAFTETREGRVAGRHIPRAVMLKVIRRDGQICQICNTPVPDDQVELDHLIPHVRGGPSAAHNLRVVCRSCNRRKRDSLDELVDPDPWNSRA